MTSKLTREQLHERARENVKALKMASRQTAFESAREEILADLQLAELALSAMDSEPVAEVVSIYGDPEAFGEREIRPLVGIQQMQYGTKLYRHVQPAPVVQCPFPCGWDNLNKLAIQDAALVARGLVEGELTTEAHRQAAISNNDRLLKVISACRAAMLNGSKS